MEGFSFHSHRTQLVATAVAASATTAALFSLYNSLSKRSRRRDLNQDILRSITSSTGGGKALFDGKPLANNPKPKNERGNAKEREYDEDLIREQLARNYAFFGDEAMAKIRGGSVVVVGCGGVGSWAAVMLVRSGVSKIRLVDFDYVTLSSLNRHATAALPDVGTPKVKCVERALREIARWVEVDARVELWRKEDGAKLLEGADWVVDAIDNIQTKVDLLKHCYDNKIKVFSSMGAGAKCDPTRIQISDIASTVYDPLARAVRRRLRLLGVPSGIPVVYSTEVPSPELGLLPLPEDEFQKGKVHELGVFDDFRVRILPVLGPLPSIFGLHIATYILCELGGKPIPSPLPVKNRRKLYERLQRDLLVRESKRAGVQVNRLPLSLTDVELIVDDLHRGGRSVLPPHAVPAQATLVRWDADEPLTVGNCVLMERADAERHEREGRAGENGGRGKTGAEIWGEEAEKVVQRRKEEARRVGEWVM
ncbi:ubiquitin-protein ligase molybdopterin-converting factor [Mycena galericulata]|nr:ubiquitin-protein ligase molybdopterin-converting factor [Mycena galericulata]